LPLQKAADPMGDGERQLGEFGAGRRLDPAEPGCSIGTLNVYASLAFETATRASTGYVFAVDAWGMGYATECVVAMKELAVRLSVRRLYAGCPPGTPVIGPGSRESRVPRRRYRRRVLRVP
jgi:RimJ/RimL family protein N-acetyltransferase